MSEQVKKPVGIMETVLRDAHQSLIATRMPTEVMLPIVDKMDKVGYAAVECWGGATFDVCYSFLHESPWERLRQLRKRIPTIMFLISPPLVFIIIDANHPETAPIRREIKISTNSIYVPPRIIISKKINRLNSIYLIC